MVQVRALLLKKMFFRSRRQRRLGEKDTQQLAIRSVSQTRSLFLQPSRMHQERLSMQMLRLYEPATTVFTHSQALGRAESLLLGRKARNKKILIYARIWSKNDFCGRLTIDGKRFPVLDRIKGGTSLWAVSNCVASRSLP